MCEVNLGAILHHCSSSSVMKNGAEISHVRFRVSLVAHGDLRVIGGLIPGGRSIGHIEGPELKSFAFVCHVDASAAWLCADAVEQPQQLLPYLGSGALGQ